MVKPVANVKGVILAGGWSSRFGTNKALANFQGMPLIERVILNLSEVFSDLLIVTNTPQDYEQLRIPILTDLVPHQGPMGGIVTALAASNQAAIFVAACDLSPLLPELIHAVLEIDENPDAVIPIYEGRKQYLSALYSPHLLTPMLEYLRQGEK